MRSVERVVPRCLGEALRYNATTADAVDGAYGEVPVRFIGRNALIRNKTASGRPEDLADVDLLTPDDSGR